MTFPPYELRTLANGLQLVVVRQNEQPVVSVRMLVRAGSAQDPTDKPGVAEMVATLLDQGTTARSAAEIADTIDFMGGGLGTGAGTDLSFANTILLQSKLDEGLQLLADVIRRPAFSAEELERQREQLLSALKVSYQDPDYVAGAVVERLIFGFHPYGKPGNGTPESVAALTRDDLVAFHKRWYHPNNTLIAIVGDVSVETRGGGRREGVRRLAARHRAGHRPRPIRRSRRVASSSSIGRARCRPRSASASWRSAAHHHDYMPLNLAVKILGGEGGNRLQGVLRSDRGLTYGASADMDAFQRVRGHRRRHRHADRDDRRGAAPDRRRVHPPAAGSGQRARARFGAGLPRRQLRADHRDAGRDRAEGAERDLLRARSEGAARSIRSRSTGSPPTTSSAWRAPTCVRAGWRSCWSATPPSSSPS